MADWADLNGQRVISGTLQIGYFGAWVADVVLALAQTIPTTGVTFTIGDLSLVGTVYRQFTYGGSRSARLYGGFGGWLKTVAAKSYANPSGVATSIVMGDLAVDCGETIGTASLNSLRGSVLGPAFVRESAPASRILRQISPQIASGGQTLWWTDATGATQIVERTGLAYTGVVTDTAHLGAIASAFNVINWSGGKGKFVIATETLSDWMPGRTFSDPNVTVVQTISSVLHTFTGEGKNRTEVLAIP